MPRWMGDKEFADYFEKECAKWRTMAIATWVAVCVVAACIGVVYVFGLRVVAG